MLKATVLSSYPVTIRLRTLTSEHRPFEDESARAPCIQRAGLGQRQVNNGVRGTVLSYVTCASRGQMLLALWITDLPSLPSSPGLPVVQQGTSAGSSR